MNRALLMEIDKQVFNSEYEEGPHEKMTNLSSILNTTNTEEVPEWLYTFLGGCLSVFGIVGIFANGIALLVFMKNKSLQSPMNTFIICLLVNDLVMCLIGIPLTAVANFYGSFVHGFDTCVFQGFIMFFGSISSLFMFGAISLYRYILITNSSASSFNPTYKNAKIAILTCYCLGLFWSIAPFTEWTSYEYEAIGTTCAVRLNTVDPGALSYNACLFVFCYLMPIVVMLFSYIMIYRKLKTVNRTPAVTRKSKAVQSRMRQERKVIRTIVLMVVAFLLSWSPYAAVAFWRAFGFGNLPAVVSGVPSLLAKSSVLWDPFIYAFTNSQFREALTDLLPCKKLRVKLNLVSEAILPHDSQTKNTGNGTKVVLVSISPT